MIPFTFEIDDPAGNSYIKNPYFPKADPNLKIDKYTRTIEALRLMGYEPDNATPEVATTEEEKNNAVREKFHKMKLSDERKDEIQKMSADLQTRHPQGNQTTSFSANDVDKMMDKAQEINKNAKYSAHKMDFTKPIETQDVEGRLLVTARPND